MIAFHRITFSLLYVSFFLMRYVLASFMNVQDCKLYSSSRLFYGKRRGTWKKEKAPLVFCHCWDGVIKFLVAVDNFPRDYFPCGVPQAAP